MNCTIEVGRIGAYINIRWINKEREHESVDRRIFLPTVMDEIEKRRGLTGMSTVENELTAVRSFTRYAGLSLMMADLTPGLIRGYERWLLGRGIKPNTSACYMRSLRSVLNRCGADGKASSRRCEQASSPPGNGLSTRTRSNGSRTRCSGKEPF